jgi:hypothetical protein
MEHALLCPQCNAPLTPHRFASTVVCAYCGTTVRLDESSVSAAIFHAAYRAWNSPGTAPDSSWVSLGGRHWLLEKLIAPGAYADVYSARLARWPTELAILKVLRHPQDAAPFDNEWNALQALQKSQAAGADTFTRLLPQPILHGELLAGPLAGQRVSIFRRAGGFHHNFTEVIRAYPQGIPPRAAIWVWRRILEVLAFLHASGMAHGAIIPAHLLLQENEHGARLVGYTSAGPLTETLRSISPGDEAFYPQPAPAPLKLTPQLDLAMSARCMIALLGGDLAAATLPDAVPAPMAGLVKRIALAGCCAGDCPDAWGVRGELGELARQIYGPPQFAPIRMPS